MKIHVCKNPKLLFVQCTCTCLCVDAMLACRLCLIHIIHFFQTCILIMIFGIDRQTGFQRSPSLSKKGSESVWPGLGGWDFPNPIDLSVGWSSGNQSFFFGGMFRKNDLERNASGYFIGWSTVEEQIKHDLAYQGKGKKNFY